MLMRHYGPKLNAAAYGMGIPAPDREDYIQEVFETAWRYFQRNGENAFLQVEGSGDRLGCWLRVVLLRRWLTARRKHRRQTNAARLDAPVSVVFTRSDQSTVIQEERITTVRALAQLDPLDQQVVAMKVANYRHKEVARLLKLISDKAAKQRLRRALEKLRDFMNEPSKAERRVR